MTNPETSSDLVKALKWRLIHDESGMPIWRASKPFGSSYHVEGRDMDQWEWMGTIYDTAQAAQAACQADYTTKILSAIDPTTIERLTVARDEARTEATAWANKALQEVGALRSDLDEALETIGRGIMRLPAGGRADGLLEGISDLRRRAEAAESLNARQAEALKVITTHHSARTDFSGTTDTLHEIREIALAALATESSNGQ